MYLYGTYIVPMLVLWIGFVLHFWQNSLSHSTIFQNEVWCKTIVIFIECAIVWVQMCHADFITRVWQWVFCQIRLIHSWISLTIITAGRLKHADHKAFAGIMQNSLPICVAEPVARHPYLSHVIHPTDLKPQLFLKLFLGCGIGWIFQLRLGHY